MTYTLNARQRRLYTHTCEIWSVSRTIGVNGKPGPEVPTKIASGVKCFYSYTPNVDDVTDEGRFVRSNFFTTDTIHFHIDENVQNGFWLKNTTPNNKNAGQVHKILGAPQLLPGSTRRPLMKQSVSAMVDEHPPAELL